MSIECVDLMDNKFCEKAFLNDYCDERFYWNGKSITEWCSKTCRNCINI